MRFCVAAVFYLLSFNSLAGFSNYCGTVEKIYTWANGGDAYGVWVQLDKNPPVCSGGFYLSQRGNNRELIYSFLLSAEMSKDPICIQTNPEVSKISTRCKINYTVNK